jgi:hypothetical protein
MIAAYARLWSISLYEEVRLDITHVTRVQRTWQPAKKNDPAVKVPSLWNLLSSMVIFCLLVVSLLGLGRACVKRMITGNPTEVKWEK